MKASDSCGSIALSILPSSKPFKISVLLTLIGKAFSRSRPIQITEPGRIVKILNKELSKLNTSLIFSMKYLIPNIKLAQLNMICVQILKRNIKIKYEISLSKQVSNFS